jgi:hypothetical protein
MHIDITAVDNAGAGKNVRLLQTPDECPRCHRSVHPKVLSASSLVGLKSCQAVFRCPHEKCQETFIATYEDNNTAVMGLIQCYSLIDVAPRSAVPSVFPETISKLSPNFVEIIGQSREAEAADLNQLVGIGLRKALEFLVKDYAASEFPGSEQDIRKSLLAACINTYISDTNVKECAKRAAWLGNDETHYTRKWENKDISDLKLLVHLTVNWIDNSVLTKKYIYEMSGGKA